MLCNICLLKKTITPNKPLNQFKPNHRTQYIYLCAFKLIMCTTKINYRHHQLQLRIYHQSRGHIALFLIIMYQINWSISPLRY